MKDKEPNIKKMREALCNISWDEIISNKNKDDDPNYILDIELKYIIGREHLIIRYRNHILKSTTNISIIRKYLSSILDDFYEEQTPYKRTKKT